MHRPKRKRISSTNIVNSELVLMQQDDKAYVPNSSSDFAKKIKVYDETLNIEIWIDKHYQNRSYHGSDDGSKRNGIEYRNIEPLLIKSFKHLLYYSLKHKYFVFINHPPNKVYNIRLVLKQLVSPDLFLNAVVEYHFVDLKTIEVTIVTALLKDKFIFSEGQFGIEFEDDYSTLLQFKNRKFEQHDTFFI